MTDDLTEQEREYIRDHETAFLRCSRCERIAKRYKEITEIITTKITENVCMDCLEDHEK
jgi:hypothetical protein